VRRLVLATANPGKLRELKRLLGDVPFEVLGAAEAGCALEVEEDGETYAENAQIKARAVAAACGELALGDDSGIEVDALGGRPGLHSARYGGPGLDDRGRLELLLQELDGVPGEARTARYRAVVALAEPEGPAQRFEATWEGRIALAPRGKRGFGYDPIFEIADGRTAAELDDAEKDRVSHRGIATRLAAEYLRRLVPA
jgi:XTP/dITP diphosphohydrolase